MPVTTSYPGIYIQELPSSSHSIPAAPTNIAVVIGYTHPLKTVPANWGVPVQLFGFMDYQRQFGGFLRSAAFAAAGNAYAYAANPAADPNAAFGDMAVAVNQFFLNGGTQAYVVGIQSNPPVTGASVTIGSLIFTATEITDEVFTMTITVRPVGSGTASPATSPPPDEIADIVISYGPASGPGTVTETYRRVSMEPTEADGKTPNPDYVPTRLSASQLVKVALVSSPPGPFPAATVTQPFTAALPAATPIFEASDFTAAMQQDGALDKLSIFNLMVIPGVTNSLVLSTALAFCERKRAFLIMDPPITASADGTDPTFPLRILDVMNGIDAHIPIPPEGANSALYFPYLKSPDPLTGASTNPVTGQVSEVAPAATVAGIYAATDLARGVWKAPAGFQATTSNTTGVVNRGRMTDQRQGPLNLIGVNCLRDFPNIGTAVFGARTLVTTTDEQWRYVPVRRMALFIEQSLYAALTWVVFEPNADPLWAAITMSVNSFMLGLFRQGAFQGTTPTQAFSVQCNSQTTTQTDIDQGVVNIVVAFAPLKPAEFVVIIIAQLAGQAQTG
jgi:phage tail sheath protein FI